MEHNEFWLRLALMKKVTLSASLVESAHFFEQLQYDLPESLFILGLSHSQVMAFQSVNSRLLASALTWLEQPHHYLICWGSQYYSPLLMTISDPPTVLFAIGQRRLLSGRQIAMVGSRKMNHYGQRWARQYTQQLVEQQLTITSGLALGIDSVCHQAALACDGQTVAVLGSGLAMITPRVHLSLAHQIIEQQGLIISEFFPFEPAFPHHFPHRNRIISGLSLAVIIVQAAKRSGSLVTARCAAEQGREVFALPGQLDDRLYEGNHWLIQQGAHLLTSINDLLYHLQCSMRWEAMLVQPSARPSPALISSETQIALPLQCDEISHKVLSVVDGELTDVGKIAERAGLSVTVVMVALIELELAGAVKGLSGGYYRI